MYESSDDMKIINKYILMFLLISMAVGCDSERVIEPSGKTVKIGVIAPLSGDDEDTGKSGLEGVKVAVSLQPYLDNGDKIELVVLDDKSLPPETSDAFDSMQHNKVAGVLLLSRSNSALAMAKKNRWMKTPVIATIASHPQLMDYSSYIVQLSFDDAFQGRVAAMFMRDELLLDRAVVISYAEDAHSSFLAEKFIMQFKSTQGVVLNHIVLSEQETPLHDQLLSAKSSGAQLLYIPVQSGFVLRIARVLKELNWKPVLMTSDGVLSEVILKHKDELAMLDGMMATDMHSSMLSKTEFGKGVTEVFYEQKRKRGSTFTILGSEGAAVLINALNRATAPYEPQDVKKELNRTSDFEGFSGTISIDEDGKAIRPVYVNIIKAGKLDLVVKVY